MRSSSRLAGQLRRNYAESDDSDDEEQEHGKGRKRQKEEDEDAVITDEDEDGDEDEDDERLRDALAESDEYAERLRDAREHIKEKLSLRDGEVRSAVSALHFFHTYTEYGDVLSAMRALRVSGLSDVELRAVVRIGAASTEALHVPSDEATDVFAPMCRLMSGAWQSVLLHLPTVLGLALSIEAALKLKNIKQRVAGGAATAEAAVARLVLAQNGVHDDNFVDLFLRSFEQDAVEETAARMRTLVQRTLPALTPCALIRCVVLKLVDAHRAAKEEGLGESELASVSTGRTNTTLYDSWRPKGALELVHRTPGLCFVSVFLGTYDANSEHSWLGERCSALFDGPRVGTPAYYDYRQVHLQSQRVLLPLHAGEYALCTQDAVTDVLNRALRSGRIGEVVRGASELYAASRVTASLHSLGRASPAERHGVYWMRLDPSELVATETQRHWLTPRYELPCNDSHGASAVTFFVLCNERPLCLARREANRWSRHVVKAPYLDVAARAIVGADDTETAVGWREDLSDVGATWSEEACAPAVRFLAARA